MSERTRGKEEPPGERNIVSTSPVLPCLNTYMYKELERQQGSSINGLELRH